MFAKQLAYVPATSAAEVEARDTTPSGAIRERVTLDAGYDDERMQVYVFLPAGRQAAVPVGHLLPGAERLSGAHVERHLFPGRLRGEERPGAGAARVQGIVRALGPGARADRRGVFPGGAAAAAAVAAGSGTHDRLLDDAEDIDPTRIGYYGRSFGASMPLPLLALEPRLKLAVLYSGGFTYRRLPAEADALNYVAASRCRC